MENNQHHRFYDILSDYSNYFYKHKDNDKLEAEYILNENKFILRYDKTTVILLNYLLSNNHCGIILSNQEHLLILEFLHCISNISFFLFHQYLLFHQV